MEKGLRRKPEPFDSFSAVLKVLVVAGFWKLSNPRNQLTKICHKIYRVLVIFIMYTYTVQHGFHCWAVRTDTEKFVEAVILEFPEVALCFKMIVLYFRTARLDKLTELLKDSHFAPRNTQDEIYIKDSTAIMTKLVRFVVINMSGIVVFYVISPLVKRMQDPNASVPSYMPFHTDTWPRLILADFLDISVVLWIAYGHFSIDCLIATYYAQARVQLKIINYNIKHLFDSEHGKLNGFQYIDELDKTTQKRFVHYVDRYEKVVWYTNEVTSVFGQAMMIQFFLTCFATCLVVYQMSSADMFSVPFIFMVGYYFAMQFQVFVYCYYGGLVEYESKLVSDSLYQSEWVSLSPRFRRQLVIAMTRWVIPITPRVSSIIPLSLTTFISISRSAYTLYTVLKNNNNKGSGQKTLTF